MCAGSSRKLIGSASITPAFAGGLLPLRSSDSQSIVLYLRPGGSISGSYCIATSAFRTGADATRSSYGSALSVISAYRCPDKEFDIGSRGMLLTTSPHSHGYASDWNDGTSHANWNSIATAIHSSSGCVEPQMDFPGSLVSG